MINIRPHHLLCIHGFRGRGYSSEFVQSMTAIVNKVKTNKDLKLNVVYSTDDICQKCPHKLGENLCDGQEKITKLDDAAIKTLQLQERVYSYVEILDKINNNLNEEVFKRICSKCQWYSLGYCQEGLFSR